MNRIFKVVFNHVLGRHVAVSEVASSIQRGALKAVAVLLAVGAMSCFGLPASAKTYEVDSVSEKDFKSGLSVDYTSYSTGVNQNTGETHLGMDTKTASGLQTVTVGINATHAYLPDGKIVLVQESSVPSNENYNTYVGRFNTLEKTESERIGIITNQGKVSKAFNGTLSEDSAMSADGTEFTGTYTAEDGKVYRIVGKRGAKQPNGLYAWTTTITDQYGNSHTTSSINYMSIENSPADVTNVYTVTAKYEGGEWATSIVDQNGNAPTDPKMTTITGPVENKELDMNIGKVDKKADGYFMTNTIKTTGQITGTVDEKTATVKTGDVVSASVSENGNELTISVNGEETTFSPVHYYGVNDGGEQQDNYNGEGAVGKNALAAGVKAKAEGESSIAIGKDSTASGEDSIVIGTGNTVAGSADGNANNTNNTVTNNGSGNTGGRIDPGAGNNNSNASGVTTSNVTDRTVAADGSNSSNSTNDENPGKADGNSNSSSSDSGTGVKSIAIGSRNTVYGGQSVAIGTGHVIAANRSGAIGDPAYITGDDSYAIGNSNNISAPQGFVLGNNSTVSGQGGIVAGSSSKVTAKDSVAIGNNAVADKENSVALGSGSKTGEVVGTSEIEIPGSGKKYSNISGTKPVGTVSVGDKGQERTITNVAAGRVGPGSTDAINGSQLYAVTEQVGQNTQRIGNLERRIGAVRQDANAGVAMALAAASLPQAYLPGKSMMAMAAGTYLGEQGYAIGFSSVSDDGKWIFKANASGNSQGHYGAAVGAGYQW